MDDTEKSVKEFSAVMLEKLFKNRHKGGPSAWRSNRPEELFIRMLMEAAELNEALLFKAPSESVAREAADVANFAMMIADSYRHRDKQ